MEVKGGIPKARCCSHQERVLASLNAPNSFILAIVLVDAGFAREPVYVRRFAMREPAWNEAAVIFKLDSLISSGAAPN